MDRNRGTKRKRNSRPQEKPTTVTTPIDRKSERNGNSKPPISGGRIIQKQEAHSDPPVGSFQPEIKKPRLGDEEKRARATPSSTPIPRLPSKSMVVVIEPPPLSSIKRKRPRLNPETGPGPSGLPPTPAVSAVPLPSSSESFSRDSSPLTSVSEIAEIDSNPRLQLLRRSKRSRVSTAKAQDTTREVARGGQQNRNKGRTTTRRSNASNPRPMPQAQVLRQQLKGRLLALYQFLDHRSDLPFSALKDLGNQMQPLQNWNRERLAKEAQAETERLERKKRATKLLKNIGDELKRVEGLVGEVEAEGSEDFDVDVVEDFEDLNKRLKLIKRKKLR